MKEYMVKIERTYRTTVTLKSMNSEQAIRDAKRLGADGRERGRLTEVNIRVCDAGNEKP